MPRAIWLVFVNEFHLLARDRVGICMLLFAPVVIILVAGLSLGNIYGVGPGRGAYIVAIVDEDHGVAAGAIVSALQREPSLSTLKVDKVTSARAIVDQLDRTPIAIVIPAGTTHALETGSAARLVLYVDPVKRLEVTAIELRVGEVCRQITAHAQNEARRQILQQSATIQRQLEQFAGQIKHLQTVVKRYRHQLIERRDTVEASLNGQAQRAVAEFDKQARVAIERSTAEAKSALGREMAPRRAALLAVSRYLIALQATEHEFDKWLAALNALAGSHAAQIPPPPVWPLAPSKEQLSELSKPIVLPAIVPPRMPTLPHLAIKLPDLPRPPSIELPQPGPFVPFSSSALGGYIDWHEQSIAGGSAQPNAFDQYVPGFGITFLLTAMLLVPSAAISFAAAAFSLVIACVARTHDSVMPIGAVAAMAMSAIGGCWWPLDFEPAWMRAFARLLPTTWTMQAYNELMIRHSTAAGALWPSAFAAVLGLLYLIV